MSENFFIIGKPDCPWCVKAKKMVTDSGNTYTYLDYTTGGDWAKFVKANLEFTTVPQVFNETGWWIGGSEALVNYLNGNYKQ